MEFVVLDKLLWLQGKAHMDCMQKALNSVPVIKYNREEVVGKPFLFMRHAAIKLTMLSLVDMWSDLV